MLPPWPHPGGFYLSCKPAPEPLWPRFPLPVTRQHPPVPLGVRSPLFPCGAIGAVSVADGGWRLQVAPLTAASHDGCQRPLFHPSAPASAPRAPAQASRRSQECRGWRGGAGWKEAAVLCPFPPPFSSERAEFPTVAAGGGAGRRPGAAGHETQLGSGSLEKEEEEDRWG